MDEYVLVLHQTKEVFARLALRLLIGKAVVEIVLRIFGALPRKKVSRLQQPDFVLGGKRERVALSFYFLRDVVVGAQSVLVSLLEEIRNGSFSAAGCQKELEHTSCGGGQVTVHIACFDISRHLVGVRLGKYRKALKRIFLDQPN
jgi:hypothetical protein